MSLFYYPYPNLSATTDEPILVELNARLVPIIISALERYKYKQFWATEGDYIIGVGQICIAQEALLTGTQAITEAVDRVYRLIDTIHNGTPYTAPTSEPADITPAIPLAPPSDVGELPGLRRQLLDMQGMTPGGWFGIGARPATLADIAEALRAGTGEDVERIDTVLETLQAASSGANIFGALRGFITDTAALGAEGATLAAIIAAAAAQAAMAGLQAAQLDAMNTALAEISAKLAAIVPAAPEDTISGELASIRDNLTP